MKPSTLKPRRAPRLILLTICGLINFGLAGCASSGPPRNINDLCAIFDEKPRWRDAARDSSLRWGAPVPTQMAIIWRESKFEAQAQPRQRYVLGIIPWGRASSAYGYAQAIDGTWDWYRRESGNSGADRDDFTDSVDFVGWYMNRTRRTNGVPVEDSYNQYLAYHEGHGGYNAHSYADKPWLMKAAKEVARVSARYADQLHRCPS